jgi:hypothetical protein
MAAIYKIEGNRKKYRIKQFLIDLAPDFCWCTGEDLFLMMEVEHEDVQQHCFEPVLSRMKADGYFWLKVVDGRVYYLNRKGKVND